MRRCAFWHRACSLAVKWSRYWTPTAWPHVTDLGEDLLEIAVRADDQSQLSLAAACRSLRGLLLPRLMDKKAQSIRSMYRLGTLG